MNANPLICNACDRAYLEDNSPVECLNPSCRQSILVPLLGFISYRRKCQTYKGLEDNDLAIKIKDRVEKVLFSQRYLGGFFIDRTGIEQEDFEEKILKAIQACQNRVFLLILTPHSLDPRNPNEDDWMLNEIRLAMKYQLKIIPVRVSKYRNDIDFMWPDSLPSDLLILRKKI